MELLTKESALEYKGGAKITLGIATFWAAVTAFVLGVIDGFSNPKKA